MSDKVYLKIHRSGGSEVVAVCDPELIGKTIRGSNRSITISEKFYRGMLVSQEEAFQAIQLGQNINLVGKIIFTLLKNKLINAEAVMWFENDEEGEEIPHLLIIRL